MTRKSLRRYLNYAGRGAVAGALAVTLACASGDSPRTSGSRDSRVAEQVDDHLNRARAELRAENYDRAMAAVDKAYQLDKDNREVIRLRQEILSARNEAVAEPGTTQVDESAIASADNLLRRGQYEEAAQAYRDVLREDRDNRDAREGLRRAESELREQRQGELETIVQAGEDALEAGNLDEARSRLAAAQAIDPQDSDVEDLADEINERAQEVAEAEREAREREVAAARERERTERERAEAAERERREQMERQRAEEQRREREAAERAEQQAAERAERERQERETAQAAERERTERERALQAERERQERMERLERERAASEAAERQRAERDRAEREASSARQREDQQAARQAQASRDAAADTVMPMAPESEADATVETVTVTPGETARASEEALEQAEDLFERGLDLYEENPESYESLNQARTLWAQALEAAPTFERARVYLDETEAEFQTLQKEINQAESFEAREAAAREMMATPIPINTIQPTPLAEFLRTVKLLSGIDFTLMGAEDVRIEAAFTDKPLTEVLDAILLPIGLKWERKPGETTVVITPDLRTRVFRVTPEQLTTVDSLLQRGTLQEILYGQSEAVLPGQEVYTDPRQSIIVITDSQLNIEKFANLVTELREQDPVGLVYRSYLIREDKAQEIKALLEAVLGLDDDLPYNPERKLIVAGAELIVKDTPENIRRVEELLNDREFLREIYSGRLAIESFNLTPVLEIQDNPDLARTFGENVVQQVETVLYSQEGKAKAQSEGRRLWWDPATLQLTITDFPDNLSVVEGFINSLPQIDQRRRSKIVFLDWATASALASDIDSFLNPGGSDDGAQDGADEVSRTLRVEQEVEFRGAFFRVTRVETNDEFDENDDQVELIARSRDESDEITIEEFQLENVLGGEFTIVADEIDPSNVPGEGRAELTFIYNGPGGATGGGGGGGFGDGGGGGVAANEQEEDDVDEEDREGPLLDVSIEAIENLNALWISYGNAGDLQEVEFWIETLDVPTLQVSMEIKFVEVVENKARQLKADFVTGDLTQGLSLSDSIVRNRFAQDIDEFQNPFEPFTEGVGSANLLKGATVTNWIINNGETPISLQLRALEAQGVINVVNAPSITVLNNETANFTISTQFYSPFLTGATTTGGNQQGGQTGGGTTGGGTTGGGTTGGGTTGGGTTGGTTGGNIAGGVANNFAYLPTGQQIDIVDNLEVTPTVTQAGNITLSPIEVVIRDFDQNLAALSQFASTTTLTNPLAPQPTALTNTGGFRLLEKDIETSARIRDGGTVVLGGWKNERAELLDSGVPVLRDIPFVGKFLFNRMQQTSDRVTLLIFLTGSVVRD